MTDERDPLIESLFAEAEQDFSDDEFVASCMQGVHRRSRRVIASRIAIAVLIIAFELALDAPLKNSVGALASAMRSTDAVRAIHVHLLRLILTTPPFVLFSVDSHSPFGIARIGDNSHRPPTGGSSSSHGAPRC